VCETCGPWRQAPWDPRPEIFFFNWTLVLLCNVLSNEKMGLSLWICLAFRQVYLTYSMLLKILPFALPVQFWQSRSCLSYVSLRNLPVITSRHGSHRKHSSSIVSVFVAAEMCLPCRCVATAAARITENTVPILLYHCWVRVGSCGNVFTEPLPRNGSGRFVYLAIVA
jgi:hypothetical protein